MTAALTVGTELPQLRVDEGFRERAYIDTEGYLTIGYGTCIAQVGDIPFDPIYTIDQETASMLLRKEAMNVYMEMDRLWPWFDGLPLGVKTVMVNMAYNLGVPRLQKFKKTLGYIQAGQYEYAAREMLLSSDGVTASKWYQQVGDRAKRLSDRLRG